MTLRRCCFGLDGFRVVDVVRVDDRVIQVLIETVESSWACPECGARSSRVKDRPLVQVKDLPASGQQVVLWWRKRRWCARWWGALESSVVYRVDHGDSGAVAADRAVARRVGDCDRWVDRAVAEVAAAFGVAWHTAHTALVTAAAQWLPAPPPTRVLMGPGRVEYGGCWSLPGGGARIHG